MSKHALARKFNDNDPRFQRELRREADSLDSKKLQKRRMEFERNRGILGKLIEEIQKLNQQREHASGPAEQDQLNLKANDHYTIASLLGIRGLFDGLGLICDMLSIQEVTRGPDGKKYYERVPVLLDMAEYLEDVMEYQILGLNMTQDIGLKQQAFWLGKYDIPEPDKRTKQKAGAPKEPESPGITLTEPAPIGVPEADLLAASQDPTPEQVQEALKGNQ
jgi:hypothetical protein